jgi:hypothetical protein
MEERELLTQIDACRPGSDDLHSPDMSGDLAELNARIAADPVARALYDRVQATDATLGSAFRDVAAPSGLAERILARLAEEVVSDEATRAPLAFQIEAVLQHARVPVSESPAASSPAAHSDYWRRPLRYGAAALAASLLVALIAWQSLRPDPITAAVLPDRAVQFFSQDTRERVAVSNPKAYPLSQQIARRNGATRRAVNGFLDYPAVAYDLRYRKLRATVYVVRAVVDGLPDAPPLRPDATTGGSAVGAWQEGELLYVLVVAGGEREYRRFVEPQGGVARLELVPADFYPTFR